MARFSEKNLATAVEIVSRYPRAKSATIPLLHLAQEQDGWVLKNEKDAVKVYYRKTPGVYELKLATSIKTSLSGVVRMFDEELGREDAVAEVRRVDVTARRVERAARAHARELADDRDVEGLRRAGDVRARVEHRQRRDAADVEGAERHVLVVLDQEVHPAGVLEEVDHPGLDGRRVLGGVVVHVVR